jgi:hypothetical protein
MELWPFCDNPPEDLMRRLTKGLLTCAAFLMAQTAAHAADLPSKKAAPAEYVRVCSAYGVGFFTLPGTDTCLRVSGRVRGEYRYNQRFTRADDVVGIRARARLNTDVRTQTEFGVLRAFARYELTADTGIYGANGVSINQTKSLIEKAFIQWAGLTAGRAQSFFDFYADEYNWQDLRGSDNYSQNLLAYTQTFGSGFSATLSLEDGIQRRAANTGLANSVTYAGERMPDIVGVLRVDQAWGSAQLSGALHQIQALNFAAPVGGVQQLVDTTYGFALQGGVKFNLPMLAQGDVFWLQALYVDGAIGYMTAQHAPLNGSLATPTVGAGYVSVSNSDAYIDALGGVHKTKGFALTSAFMHYWTPKIRQAFFGSYMRLDYDKAVSSPRLANGAVASGAVVDQSEWRVGSNLIWSPVSGLDIGMEVFYVHLDPKGRITTNTGFNPVLTKTVSSDGVWETRLRIQRDF